MTHSRSIPTRWLRLGFLTAVICLGFAGCASSCDDDEEIETGDAVDDEDVAEDEDEGTTDDEGDGEQDDQSGLELGEDFHLVVPGETLGGIVRDRCGSAEQALLWHVVDTNSSNQQPDGEYLLDVDRIEVGWILEIPCELPLPDPIDCPSGFATDFEGEGDGVRVMLCSDDGRTEYFGQRLNDMASIVLDACRTDGGEVNAVNPGETNDTYYVVQPGQSVLTILRTEPGEDPASGSSLGRFELETVTFNDGAAIRPCQTATETPPEDQPELELELEFIPYYLTLKPIWLVERAYPLDRAPLNRVDFDRTTPVPDGTQCDSGVGPSQHSLTERPPEAATFGPGADQWHSVAQGSWLRFEGIAASRDLNLTGGGHSWPLRVTSDGLHVLLITDEQPLGRYAVVDQESEATIAQVEVKAATEQVVIRDPEASSGDYYVFRIFALGADPVDLMVAFTDGCNGTERVVHQRIPTDDRSDSGVLKVGIDMSSAPSDRVFFLAVDGWPEATLYLQ